MCPGLPALGPGLVSLLAGVRKTLDAFPLVSALEVKFLNASAGAQSAMKPLNELYELRGYVPIASHFNKAH